MASGSKRKFKSALFLGSALSVLGAPAFAQSVDVSTPAEALSQTLKDIAKQTGENIIFTPDAVAGISAPAVSGKLDARQAVERAISGTSLEVVSDGNGGFIVRRPESKNVEAAASDGAANSIALETVTVTGTHLRGTESLTPVQTITSADLANQGYTTLSDAIQQLPQNSNAGVSAQTAGPHSVGNGSINNTGYASGVNLRGLGPGDTLILLNGRRLPPTAYGDTTDISGIPASAIDRVEILSDGASAIYGSDAVAGVVNIITKKNYDGVETGVHFNNVSDGKQPDAGGYALAGFDWDSGGLLLNYDYESEKPLLGSARSFSQTALNPTYLLPKQNISTVYGSLNQQFTPDLVFSADAIFSSREAVSNNNLGGGLGNYPETVNNEQFSGSAELDYTPDANWRVSVIGGLGNEHDRFHICYTGSPSCYPKSNNYGVKTVEVGATGTIFSLPGGDISVAVGGSYREESLREHKAFCGPTCGPVTTTGGDRSDFSAYGEVLLPFIGPANAVPFVKELQFDAAVRFDHYSDFGNTTNPKLTLKWVPTDGLALHGSYSTSFRAPTLDRLFGDPGTFGYLYYANGSDLSQGNALEIDQYSNTDLGPETATSYNAGLTYSPAEIPGLKFDASYFDITYRGKIEELSVEGFFGANVLNGVLGNLVNRSPTPAQIAAQLAADDGGNYCYDENCANSSISTIAYIGVVNAASVHTDGLDLHAQYELDSSIGRFTFDAATSYYLSYNQQIVPAAPSTPGSGVLNTPVRFRGKFSTGWFEGPWTANLRLNYVGSEQNPNDTSCSLAGCPIGSWTTLDISTSYAFQDIPGARFLDGTRLSVSVSNIFDQLPPFARSPAGIDYDPVNANPLGRAIAVSLTKRW